MNRLSYFNKKILTMILILAMIISLAVPVMAEEVSVSAKSIDETSDENFVNLMYADRLSEIGVFVGTGKGYELYREPNRLEALVVLIRLLGKEESAMMSYNGECPFPDVPEWGKAYVAYGYEHGLTQGLGNGTFGSTQVIKPNSFTTFMLRALGYDDAAGDFTWENANAFAYNIEMLDDEMLARLNEESFIRDQVAKIVFNTLLTKMHNEEYTLAVNLIDQGAIDQDTARTIEVTHHNDESENPSKVEVETPEETVEETEENVEEEVVNVPEGETSLLGGPTASKESVEAWARSKGMIEEGIALIDIYYEICEQKGLNPVIQYVQMCIETGYLYKIKSQAGLDASYHNPCGLKVTAGGDNYDPNAHMKFDSWYDGIDAHTDHTALYAGLEGYPKDDTKDPRHFGWLLGAGNTVETMGMRWVGKTPENDDGVYAGKILRLYNEILEIESN